MKKFFFSHGEKVAAAVVFLFCIWFLAGKWSAPEAVDLSKLSDTREEILNKIGSPSTPAAFPYKKAPDFLRAAQKVKERPEQTTILGQPADYTCYPCPAKPRFKKRQLGPGERPEYPRMASPAAPLAEADHGCVYLVAKLPENNEKTVKYMRYVRLEIYRGTSEKDMEFVGTIELAPEFIPPEGTEAATQQVSRPREKPVPVERPQNGTEEEGGSLRNPGGKTARPSIPPTVERAPRGSTAAGAAPAAGKDADTKVYKDGHVKPKTRYYYRLRAVGVMTKKINARIAVKDDNGRIKYYRRILAPRTPKQDPEGGVSRLEKPGAGGVVLYATPFTKTVSAVTPADYMFRFSGYQGKLPDPQYPRQPRNYRAMFEVKVWVPELQAWREVSLTLKPHETLKGRISWSKPGGAAGLKDFDTGYSLVEVKQVKVVKEIVEWVVQKDKDGNQVLDKNGRPVKKKVVSKGMPFTKTVAVMREKETGKLVEFKKRGDYERRKAAFAYYDRIRAELEQREKKVERLRKRALGKNRKRPKRRPRPAVH